MPKCLSKFWKKMSAGRKIRRSSHGRSLCTRAIEKHGLRRNIYTRNAERTRKNFQNNSPLTPTGANVLTYTYECIASCRLIQTIEGGTGGRERRITRATTDVRKTCNFHGPKQPTGFLHQNTNIRQTLIHCRLNERESAGGHRCSLEKMYCVQNIFFPTITYALDSENTIHGYTRNIPGRRALN